MSSSSTIVNNSDKSSKCQVCGVTLAGLSVAGLVGFAIYNFIMTIIAVISFTNNDVEDVCPNSELWWWALFIGIIWPFMLSNGAKNAAESKEESTPFLQVFVWICMLTAGHGISYGEFLDLPTTRVRWTTLEPTTAPMELTTMDINCLLRSSIGCISISLLTRSSFLEFVELVDVL